MKFKNPISFLIFFLLSVTCFSQSIVNRANSSYTVQDSRFSAQYNMFVPKYVDTTAANLQVGVDSCSAIIYTYSTHTFWYRSCANSAKKWVQIYTPTLQQVFGVQSNNAIITANDTISFNNNKKYLLFRATPNTDFGDFTFFARDTINNPDNWDESSGYGMWSSKTFAYPAYSSQTYRGGNLMQVRYEIKDSMKINSFGGDFGFALKARTAFAKMSGYSGKSLYIGGTSVNETIPAFVAIHEFAEGTSTTTNYRYARGWWSSVTGHLYLENRDTVENYAAFLANASISSDSRVNYYYDFLAGYQGANHGSARLGKHWGFFNMSPLSQNYFGGNVLIGDSNTISSALLNVTSTTKGVVWPRMTTVQKNSIASPATGLIVFDTDLNQYNFYNGSAWAAMGGSSGITTLNTLTGATQTFATGTTGTDFNISSSGTTHTFNIPDASATARGLITTGVQTIAGAKTLSSSLAVTGSVDLTSAGGAGTGINVVSTSASLYSSVDYINSSGTRFQTGLRGSSGAPAQQAFFYHPGAFPIGFFTNGTERFTILGNGNTGFQNTGPTAKIHIAAGTATANTAPLKFTSGTNLTTPEAGAVEFDGTNYFATASTTRYTIAKTLTNTATLDFASTGSGAVADLTITVTGAADGDAVTLGVPNGSVTATATYSAWVSAANTVTIRFSPKATEDPASGTFRISVIKY